MRGNNFDLIPEDWVCHECKKGKYETGFSVKLNISSPAYVQKICNRCRNLSKALKSTRKYPDYTFRKKLSNDIREYFIIKAMD